MSRKVYLIKGLFSGQLESAASVVEARLDLGHMVSHPRHIDVLAPLDDKGVVRHAGWIGRATDPERYRLLVTARGYDDAMVFLHSTPAAASDFKVWVTDHDQVVELFAETATTLQHLRRLRSASHDTLSHSQFEDVAAIADSVEESLAQVAADFKQGMSAVEAITRVRADRVAAQRSASAAAMVAGQADAALTAAASHADRRARMGKLAGRLLKDPNSTPPTVPPSLPR